MTDASLDEVRDGTHANEAVSDENHGEDLRDKTHADPANAPISEITERFFKVIVQTVSPDSIEELHLFSPLRQRGVQTGIAVIAARIPPDRRDDATMTVDSDASAAGEPTPELGLDNAATDDVSALEPHIGETILTEAAQRHVVYTARYRLTQKGPDRGKWEADVVNEADAPLLSVETVVRGVQRRAGDSSEITRYSGAQVARALRLV